MNNEIHTLTISGAVIDGTFNISVSGIGTTLPITWSSTNATLVANIQTAMDTLLGLGNCTVAVGTATAGIGTFTITYNGALANTNIGIPTVTTALAAASVNCTTTTPFVAAVSEIQRIVFGGTVTGGTFTYSISGTGTSGAITWDADDSVLESNIQSEMDSLVGVGNSLVQQDAGDFTITFIGSLGGTNVGTPSTSSSLTGTSPTVTASTDVGGVVRVPEVDTLTIAGAPTGGTFVLSFAGIGTTSPIAWSSTNATLVANVQAALNTFLGSGNTLVAVGTATAGVGTFTITFQGSLLNTNYPEPSATSSLTTTTVTVSIATTVDGTAKDLSPSAWLPGASYNSGTHVLSLPLALIVGATDADCHMTTGDIRRIALGFFTQLHNVQAGLADAVKLTSFTPFLSVTSVQKSFNAEFVGEPGTFTLGSEPA